MVDICNTTQMKANTFSPKTSFSQEFVRPLVAELLKLFIMFAVLKAFFFPAYLKGGAREKSDTVLTELTTRAAEK